MYGLEDYEGIRPNDSLEGLQNEGLSEAQKEYLQEVIPEPEEWLNMTYEERLDSVSMMELRLDEMQKTTDVMPQEYFEYVSDLKQMEQLHNIECVQNCIYASNDFYTSGRAEAFMEGDLDTREQLTQEFFEDIKESLRLDPDIPIEFCQMDSLGGYNPETNSITLNESYLECPDPHGLLKTINHESEPAFQHAVVENPHLYPEIPPKVVAEWKYNMEHYKSAQVYGMEIYRNQPIEKDAFAFENYVFAQVDKLKNLRD